MPDLTRVIKIGGEEVENPGFLSHLAVVIASQSGWRTIIVHGGGGMINDMLAKLDIQPQFIDGQRVTDDQTLVVTEMVLSGLMNKQVVRALLASGMEAAGMSGIDRGLIQVAPSPKGLGKVGDITLVKGSILIRLLEEGVIPVVSPISLGPEGAYNVNADLCAAAVAASAAAKQLVFLTNRPGIMVRNTLVNALDPIHAEALIAEGLIHSGMIPKVRGGMTALSGGVEDVIITDLATWLSGGGTKITHLVKED